MKKLKIIVCGLICMLIFNVTSISAVSMDAQIKEVLETELDKVVSKYEEDGTGRKTTFNVLNTNSFSEEEKENYYDELDALFNRAIYLSAFTTSNATYETEFKDDNGNIYGTLNLNDCQKDFSDESNKKYSCKMYYGFSIIKYFDTEQECQNSNFTNCVYVRGKYQASSRFETKKIDIKILLKETDVNEVAMAELKKYRSELNDRIYKIYDLDFLNYYLYNGLATGKSQVNLSAISNKVNSYFSSNNTKVLLLLSGGSTDGYEAWNKVMFTHDNVFYGNLKEKEITTYYLNLFFVPKGTEKSKYGEALKERIDAYLNNNKYIVTLEKNSAPDFVGIRSTDHVDYSEFDGKTFSRYTLKITDGNNTVETLIGITESDSEKIELSKARTIDTETNIVFMSLSDEIPLDANIVVNALEKESEKYKKVKEKIGNDNIEAFDIIVFSDIKGDISNIKTGNVELYIPVNVDVPENYYKVYYISDDMETLIEHKIIRFETVNNIKYAVFETNHFSTYVLSQQKPNNPKTSDNFLIYFFLLFISLSAVLIINKKTKMKSE